MPEPFTEWLDLSEKQVRTAMILANIDCLHRKKAVLYPELGPLALNLWKHHTRAKWVRVAAAMIATMVYCFVITDILATLGPLTVTDLVVSGICATLLGSASFVILAFCDTRWVDKHYFDL